MRQKNNNSDLEEIQRLLDKGFGKDDILKKVNIQDYSQEDARGILRMIDDHMVQHELIEQSKSFSRGMMIFGVFVLGLAVILSLTSLMMGRTKMVVTVGLILWGAFMIFIGYTQSKSDGAEVLQEKKKVNKGKFKRF